MIFNAFIFELENDGRKRDRDSLRALAAAIVTQATRDYHAAKKLIKRKNLAFKYHCRKSLDFLSDWEREIVFEGKQAWEWFTNEPLEPVDGWTFDLVAEVLDRDPDELRAQCLSASTYRNLRGLSKGSLCGRNHDRR